MSCSSTREYREVTASTGSRSRGQTTPIVALVALFAVCAGLSLYATTLDSVTSPGTENALAQPTLERVYDVVNDGGVVSPMGLSRSRVAFPDGYRVSVEVTTPQDRWTTGHRPPPPEPNVQVDSASRPVGVETADGDVVWGRLRVRVWR
jgi:hypothetical protein